MPKISWETKFRHKYDIRQIKLVPNGSTNLEETLIALNEKFFCPFCLHLDNYNKFIKSDKRIDLIVCPRCKIEMMKSTLTNEMTVEEFARWVFDYALKGFWKKCDFEYFNWRLKQLEIAQRFWDKYKALKGDNEIWV